ncbi:MAG: hypothetical protein JXR76_01265 [Deltaproteobacteria bacterium]|nr:hypothetical protein [Deltaproteobacteria bacterium]
MKIEFTSHFLAQKKRYNFCFTCDDCLYFDIRRDQCLHEYPNEMHLLSTYNSDVSPPYILFCKQFELR